jgi:hypothetical protein
LQELSNLSTSWTIFHIIILTTGKIRIYKDNLLILTLPFLFLLTRFTLVFFINGLCFGFLRLLIIICVLLILTLPFIFLFIFTGRCRLNQIYFRGFTRGRSRMRIILYIRSSRLGIGMTGLFILSLNMKSANHAINNMRSYWRCWGRIRRWTRSIRNQII